MHRALDEPFSRVKQRLGGEALVDWYVLDAETIEIAICDDLNSQLRARTIVLRSRRSLSEGETGLARVERVARESSLSQISGVIARAIHSGRISTRASDSSRSH